ncbi:hypothetical protein TWF481_002993 [Arthrobotrys musiformis]|uniref:Uncharacterized protein n=1 Tax=Arthrobotrys musiformis TaxID=47236 RepID=A0AAV9VTK1_9PEZI
MAHSQLLGLRENLKCFKKTISRVFSFKRFSRGVSGLEENNRDWGFYCQTSSFVPESGSEDPFDNWSPNISSYNIKGTPRSSASQINRSPGEFTGKRSGNKNPETLHLSFLDISQQDPTNKMFTAYVDYDRSDCEEPQKARRESTLLPETPFKDQIIASRVGFGSQSINQLPTRSRLILVDHAAGIEYGPRASEDQRDVLERICRISKNVTRQTTFF